MRAYHRWTFVLSFLPFACSSEADVGGEDTDAPDGSTIDGSTLGEGGTSDGGVGDAVAADVSSDALTQTDGGSSDTGVVTGDAGNTTLGQPGVWTNVTPAAITLNPSAFNNDNFGINDVLTDPARPSDFYAFTCHQGVWKSTDYGQSWTKINTGSNGSELDKAKLWTAAIDPDRTRNPNTPPTLWTAAGNRAAGVWRSTDGGVSWTSYLTNNSTAVAGCFNNNYYANDLYSLDVDPYDKNHLIGGFHGCPGISESTNGGVSWTTVNVVANMGSSIYPFFVNTGNAATTRTTWVTQPDEGSAAISMFRTDNGGATWTNVLSGAHHAHGSAQFHQTGNGTIYAPAYSKQGIFRSLDFGITWTQVSNVQANNIIGTPSTLYGFSSYAAGGNIPVRAQRAAPGAGTVWTTANTPAGMTNGPKRSATSFNGTQHVIVTGNWLAGIWRYVEP
ncbi:MAG: hypothetical protein KBF88_06325 [Polyangiaceae bacterium]|nr:hypothetical protein [Polyangiaceae bacterium]